MSQYKRSRYDMRRNELLAEARTLAPPVGSFSSENKELYHQYYMTRSGVLILDSLYYFEDTIINTGFTSFYSVAGAAGSGVFLELENKLSNDEKTAVNERMQESLASYLVSIDEILTFVWPEKAKGTVEKAFRAQIETYFSGIITAEALDRIYAECSSIASGSMDFKDSRLAANTNGILGLIRSLQGKYKELIDKDLETYTPMREMALVEQIKGMG